MLLFQTKREEKKKKGKKEEEENQEACGSFSKLLSVQLSFPFSSSPLRNKIRRTLSREFIDYETFDSKKTSLTRIKLEPSFSSPPLSVFLSFSHTRKKDPSRHGREKRLVAKEEPWTKSSFG